MRPVRDFEEFVIEGIVKKQSADRSRARFLVDESKNAYSLLLELEKKIELSDKTANMFVKSCYDILMELIRAKMLLDGYNSSGFGAHEAEVSYLRIIGFSESEVQFFDQLRYFRNGMLYYGSVMDRAYAGKVIAFTKEHYSKLMKLLGALGNS